MRNTLSYAVAFSLAFSVAVTAQVFTQKPEVAAARERGSDEIKKPVIEQPKPKKNDKVNIKAGATPQWIWGQKNAGGNDRYFLRKEFDASGVKKATLIASCDNNMNVMINGKSVASSSNWNSPEVVDVTKQIKAGKNEIVADARNAGGPAGFVAKLILESTKGKKQYIVTDKSWKAARDRNAKQSAGVHTVGKMGSKPWGNVFGEGVGAPKVVLGTGPRDVFNVLPGFQVELLYTVPKNTLGSWVSIAFDNKGRLIASDQGNKGLSRITPPKIGSDEETKVEKLNVKMTSSQGMLYAFGSLYVSVNGGPGSGLYRLRDTTGDDQYDKVEKLRDLRGGGEHGPHALRLSPDGKSIYIIAGNATNLPKFDSTTIPSNWKEDLLLPRQWDARGHARGRLAPGGWICRTDPDGKKWEVFSMGYRNPYDMDFNADGELFAYDADMEWDLGTPWYRPTRVVHAVSGSEFGWRSGTGKWATYYPDSLPPAVNIGPGSPVGAEFGYGTKFPAKYQKALYICDWTFGTMYAIHIEPDGASYKATKEEFISRTPLPLTDVAIGPDGAMYFTMGGRGGQSALFRATYVGKDSTAPVSGKNTRGAELRALRRQLESLHTGGPRDGKAMAMIFSSLGHSDRHIRYAARIALEQRPVASWQNRVLAEKETAAMITGIVALARQGDASLQQKALSALSRINVRSLAEPQQLELLRAYSLLFTRMGKPDQSALDSVARVFEPMFPSKSRYLNRELSRMLVYCNSPRVIDAALATMAEDHEIEAIATKELIARRGGYGDTIAKMFANHPDIEKVHYALVLRNMQYGWTLEQRRSYFDSLNALSSASGGASYRGFIGNIRKEAMAKLSDAEKKALASSTVAPPPKPEDLPKPKGPGKDWTTKDILALTSRGLSGRNFENGRNMFKAACIACHRYQGDGGATGPDLSNVAGRFGFAELAEAIIEPSKVISDQYGASVITTSLGDQIIGRILNEADGKVTVNTDAVDATKIRVFEKGDIDSVKPSPLSLMPNGLLKAMNKNEVSDLIAFLLSRGNPNDRMFTK